MGVVGRAIARRRMTEARRVSEARSFILMASNLEWKIDLHFTTIQWTSLHRYIRYQPRVSVISFVLVQEVTKR